MTNQYDTKCIHYTVYREMTVKESRKLIPKEGLEGLCLGCERPIQVTNETYDFHDSEKVVKGWKMVYYRLRTD